MKHFSSIFKVVILSSEEKMEFRIKIILLELNHKFVHWEIMVYIISNILTLKSYTCTVLELKLFVKNASYLASSELLSTLSSLGELKDKNKCYFLQVSEFYCGFISGFLLKFDFRQKIFSKKY